VKMLIYDIGNYFTAAKYNDRNDPLREVTGLSGSTAENIATCDH
jgi:hypothetical protein